MGETKGQVNYLEENIHHRCHVSVKDEFYNDCIGPRRFAKVKFSKKTTENNLRKRSFVESFLQSVKKKMYSGRK